MSERPPALSISASLRLPFIESWLARIQPTSVVEVGAGIGAMGYRLASRFDYRGYEPDRTSYEVVSSRLTALGRGEVRNTTIPLEPDRHFDLLVAFEVLEHIEDDVAALTSWARWLAP
ncbi:MAG TPA: class I SAM-dependent methyltransferase, partial [Acidimicrobiia bacterium]